jgi:prepilin-type N-terminal cleavage/methylation domain-containing protein
MVQLRAEGVAMNWRDQEGMTLVELLVAMTITSIVLLGISGVLVAGFHAANQWSQKISEAQTENQLAGWLDQDLHRYVPCTAAGGRQLDLCLPAATSSPSVRYATSGQGGGCPCAIVRTDLATGRQSVVTRDLVTAPIFQLACSTSTANGVDTGSVEVQSLVYRPNSQAPAPSSQPPALVLYFRAPRGGC